MRYHLATVIVHACESFSGARSISSKYDGDPNTGATIVSGYQGNIQPEFYDVVELWNDPTHSYGSSHGGLQGTKRFLISSRNIYLTLVRGVANEKSVDCSV
ncbi:MAG: hypothetical protein KIG81_00325 [Thermoguttaceae bacterium]|nr:hypothetical protein [Thermoguttaceae bacterium]